MPGKVIGRQLNIGFSGALSRSSDNVIISRLAKDEILFGDLVCLNADNTVSKATKTEVGRIVGVAVRIVKQETAIDGTVSYLKDDAVDVLTRGSMTVELKGGTPEAGGKVYVGFDKEGPFFSANATDNVLIDNMKFTTGHVDSNNMVEITIIERRV